ncbi:TPA: universal stress protein [Candidatus Bathyarchaeota archaeon]|nr:universal stress protein [Candidatus Bathyarchaeota archaeon]HIJ08560.1 universal stress protein [Candidatus Bathyarchaeota archaeon]
MDDKIKILVGYDASSQSRKALNEAITIAKRFSGFIKVISVYGRGFQQKAETSVIEVKETLKKENVEYEVELVQGSNPAKILENTAKKEDFDLIAVGSRGLGNTASMLLGSVSRHIISNAQCNVLVVKTQ